MIRFFHTFAAGMVKKDKNTQKEAARKALEILGGRAQMKYICLVAAHLIGHNTQAKDVKNNVRREIYTNSTLFQRVPNMPDGWWELTSYQDEVDELKREIEELNGQLVMKDKTIEELKAIPKEDDFVQRILKKVKHNLKRDKKTVEEIRKLMDALGRSDADKELDEWLQGKPKPVVKQVTKKFIQKNINSQVFTGNVTESDFNAGGQGNE